MTQARTVLFIGGPDAGKSNLLFRLWMSIKAGKATEADGIVSRGLPADLNYLNEGTATQLAGRFVDHTSAPPETQPTIPVSFGGFDSELTIPDRPGEDWSRLYVERRWPQGWLDYIAPTTTCLILLRAVSKDGQSSDWLAMQRFRGCQVNFAMDADHSNDPPPTQVIVVDWIQLILGLYRDRMGPGVRPRIGIIITAWDDLDSDAQAAGPMRHLCEEHKLLHDFILNNRQRADFRVFGITLFGGDLKDEAFSKRLVESEDPRRSGWVCVDTDGAVETSPDLLMPIAWALRGS